MSTDLVIIEELDKEVEKSLPCDTPKGGCVSNYESPAEWILTHPKQEGGTCSILLCNPCKEHEERFFSQQKAIKGLAELLGADVKAEFTCNHCQSKFVADDVVIRRL